MSVRTWSALRVDSLPPLTAAQWSVLRLLREALEAAKTQGQDVWQFAVEIDQLRGAHLTNTDLRRLLCWRYVEHARERILRNGRQRTFEHLRTLALPKRACFVLTARGLNAVSRHTAACAVDARGEDEGAPSGGRPQVPRWDRRWRQLWWQDCLVKEFHRPAVNQELILTALEEEGWPPRVDDPLPQTPGIDPKARLHDTIKGLNRHHLQRAITFRGDGSGTGVAWRWVEGLISAP